MKNALVSVIMPIYNCKPEYLEKSLHSLLNQTYDNLEVIIIIDSTDKRRDESIFSTIEAFKDDHRIRIIVRKGKKGFCTALNTAILHSSGQFIARLDSDDYCESTRIETQMDALRTSNIVLTGTWAYVVNEEDRKIGEIRTPISEKKIKDLIMLHNPFLHSSIVFIKNIIKEVGLYNEFYEGAEDYEFYLRVISRGYSCINIPQFLTYMRKSTNSIMRGSGWRKTRKSYIMAKYEAFTRLGYRSGFNLLFTLASIGSIIITPKMSTSLKKAIRWYHPFESS